MRFANVAWWWMPISRQVGEAPREQRPGPHRRFAASAFSCVIDSRFFIAYSASRYRRQSTLVVRQLPGRVINIESESLNFADRRSFYFQFFCVIFSACKKCLVFALFLLRHFCGSSNDVKVTLALPRETVHLGTVKFLINGFEKKVRIENWRASEIARCLSRVSDLSRLMAQLSLPTCVYKFHFATFLP